MHEKIMDLLLWFIAAWCIHLALGLLVTVTRQLADELERHGSENPQ